MDSNTFGYDEKYFQSLKWFEIFFYKVIQHPVPNISTCMRGKYTLSLWHLGNINMFYKKMPASYSPYPGVSRDTIFLHFWLIVVELSQKHGFAAFFSYLVINMSTRIFHRSGSQKLMDFSGNPDHLSVEYPQESRKSRSICYKPTDAPTYSDRCLRLPEAPKITIFAITERILPQFAKILPR